MKHLLKLGDAFLILYLYGFNCVLTYCGISSKARIFLKLSLYVQIDSEISTCFSINIINNKLLLVWENKREPQPHSLELNVSYFTLSQKSKAKKTITMCCWFLVFVKILKLDLKSSDSIYNIFWLRLLLLVMCL